MSGRGLGEAPGRLDFMGGVADYSGALVLETPIRVTTRVEVRRAEPGRLRLRSHGRGRVELPLDWLLAALRRRAEPREVRAWLDEQRVPGWTRYVVGCLWVLCRTKRWRPDSGLSFEIRSRVPESMGVSSSAALEVATLRALGRLARVSWRGTELARLGQRAENDVVGAPCGLMDQLTAEHGRAGRLLPIWCRPDRLLPSIALPEGVAVVGWPSGVAHTVSGSPYATARAATFMGRRILECELGREWSYAAEIPPSLYQRCHDRVPEAIRGRDFTRRYGATADPLSEIRPDRRYRVRWALRFPIDESFRCQLAGALLRAAHGARREENLRHIGELMLQSHEGYGSLGLGAPETDAMVEAAMSVGPERGIYGARASGGGSGGTVVVLLRNSALPRLRALARSRGSGGPGRPLIR